MRGPLAIMYGKQGLDSAMRGPPRYYVSRTAAAFWGGSAAVDEMTSHNRKVSTKGAKHDRLSPLDRSQARRGRAALAGQVQSLVPFPRRRAWLVGRTLHMPDVHVVRLLQMRSRYPQPRSERERRIVLCPTTFPTI